MAGQLIQVATETVTSAVASVTLTGIDSDDVYMVAFNNVIGTADNNSLLLRVTESGTQNTTANYDSAYKELDAVGTFSNIYATNITAHYINYPAGGNPTVNEQSNGILYIFNANNSGEYTFFTNETVFLNPFSELLGFQGGGVFTSASAVDGVIIFFSTGSIDSGTFTLYKVV